MQKIVIFHKIKIIFYIIDLLNSNKEDQGIYLYFFFAAHLS